MTNIGALAGNGTNATWRRNENPGRVPGRYFCGAARSHSRRVMRPVMMRMTVLLVAVP